jgi:sorbitol-specific phosphotransferase system component IIC
MDQGSTAASSFSLSRLSPYLAIIRMLMSGELGIFVFPNPGVGTLENLLTERHTPSARVSSLGRKMVLDFGASKISGVP